MSLSLEEAAFKAYLWLEKLHKYGMTTAVPEGLYMACPEGFSKEELLEAIRNNPTPLPDPVPTETVQELELEDEDDQGIDLI